VDPEELGVEGADILIQEVAAVSVCLKHKCERLAHEHVASRIREERLTVLACVFRASWNARMFQREPGPSLHAEVPFASKSHSLEGLEASGYLQLSPTITIGSKGDCCNEGSVHSKSGPGSSTDERNGSSTDSKLLPILFVGMSFGSMHMGIVKQTAVADG
jgi:hypothetical protein